MNVTSQNCTMRHGISSNNNNKLNKNTQTFTVQSYHNNVILRVCPVLVQNAAKWLPTLRPSKPTSIKSMPVSCYHLHPPLSLLVLLSHKGNKFYHPTNGRRLSQLGTAVRVCIPCTRLHNTVFLTINIQGGTG